MKKGLKARVASIAMACFMAVTATCGVASATTKKNCIVKGDKWTYSTSIWDWSFNSNYYQPWLNGGAHWSSVSNNKGGYQRRSADRGCTTYASCSANWFKNGTAQAGRGW